MNILLLPAHVCIMSWVCNAGHSSRVDGKRKINYNAKDWFSLNVALYVCLDQENHKNKSSTFMKLVFTACLIVVIVMKTLLKILLLILQIENFHVRV